MQIINIIKGLFKLESSETSRQITRHYSTNNWLHQTSAKNASFPHFITSLNKFCHFFRITVKGISSRAKIIQLLQITLHFGHPCSNRYFKCIICIQSQNLCRSTKHIGSIPYCIHLHHILHTSAFFR